MNISTEAMIYFAAPLCALLLLVIFERLQNVYYRWKSERRDTAIGYDFEHIVNLGIAYGEQLIEKHGIVNRADVEAAVIKYVNEAMIARGYKPFAREFTEATIRAFIRHSKGG